MSLTAPPGDAAARPSAEVGPSPQPSQQPPVASLPATAPQPAAQQIAGSAASAAGSVASPAPDASALPHGDGAPGTEAAAATANAAQAASPGAAPATTATMPVRVAVSTRPAPATAQLGTAQTPSTPPANPGSLGGAVLALFLVIGLILALAWLARRMPGLGGTRSNAALRIVGTLALGPRERVVVVAVGETQLLLGVGAGGTRTLHTLAEPLPVAAATPATPAFAQLLAQHFGKKP